MVRSPGRDGLFVEPSKKAAIPLHIVDSRAFEAFRAGLTAAHRAWLEQTQFSPKSGSVGMLPGDAVSAFVVVERPDSPWEFGTLPTRLPRGLYQVAAEPPAPVATALALGWALGGYRFERYKKDKSAPAQLIWPEHVDRPAVVAFEYAFSLARDLINTPASDMGPAELCDATRQVAEAHGARVKITSGEALLKGNYPLIHAVGRASSRAPALADFSWGKAEHPRLTLVGKGVCFDTGGLDLKSAQGMKLMKKDMGGAAFVLALAHLVMSRRLPVQLRVLIAAVENSVSGNAMRPLDVVTSRKGLTIEIGDTDAEGRLILADALTEADSEAPDLIIDAATLTGAARVALGTAMPAVFANDELAWKQLEQASAETDDPLWRLPLHKPYRNRLDSSVADLNNVGNDSYGGAITAALFLSEFVSDKRPWLHMDTMGYNLDARPGRPAGGEALGLLAFDRMLVSRYAGQALGAPVPAQNKPRPKPLDKPAAASGRSRAPAGKT